MEGMGARYTEAQKNATIKYMKMKTDEIRVRSPKGFKEIVKQAAENRGKSMNKYVYDLIVSDIKNNGPDIL